MAQKKPDMIYLEDEGTTGMIVGLLCKRMGLSVTVLKTDGTLTVEKIQAAIRAAQAPFILADFQGVGMTARDILTPLIDEDFIPRISIVALYTGGIRLPADRVWARTEIESGRIACGITKPWGDAVPDLLKQLLKGPPAEQTLALAELKRQPFNP